MFRLPLQLRVCPFLVNVLCVTEDMGPIRVGYIVALWISYPPLASCLVSLEWYCLSPATGTVPTLSAQLSVKHAHSRRLLSPWWADFSPGSGHCVMSGSCLILMQPPFSSGRCVLPVWSFCSFVSILTIQLHLKWDFCRRHMAVSCFPNLFWQSPSNWCDRLYLFNHCYIWIGVSVFVYFLFAAPEI